MGAISRLLGIPWIYDRIRPIVAGGIDRSEFYRLAEIAPGDVILDVGCGTGDALDSLPDGISYFGFDTDPVAIAAAGRRDGARRLGALLNARAVTPDDIAEIAPTVAILAGLLHHLDDAAARGLLAMLSEASSLRTAITLDVTYLRGKRFNNVMTWVDRGRFARRGGEYVLLAEESGWQVASAAPMPASPGNTRVLYWAMRLVRPSTPQPDRPTQPAAARDWRHLWTTHGDKARFLVVGTLNTVMGYVVFLCALWLLRLAGGSRITDALPLGVQGNYFIVAQWLAWVLSVPIGTLALRRWVFRSGHARIAAIGRAYAVYLPAVLLNSALLWIAVQVIGLPPELGQLLAAAIVAVFSYIGHKHFTFGTSVR